MRFLFVDRILNLELGTRIEGIQHISSTTAYLSRDHEERMHFMPTLVGESIGQLAAWNVMAFHGFQKRPVAGVVARTYIARPAYLGETIDLEAVIDRLDDVAVEYHGSASIQGETILQIEGAIGPLLPMKDFIEEEEVRQQFDNLCGEQPLVSSDASNALSTADINALLSTAHLNTSASVFDFDQLITFIPGVALTAKMTVPLSAPYFADHFPKKPVLPMTILLACKLKLAHAFMQETAWAASYQIQEFRKIKMNAFVLPGETIHCEVKLKQQTADEYILTYQSRVNEKRVCVTELVVALRRSTLSLSPQKARLDKVTSPVDFLSNLQLNPLPELVDE